jgi:hypothetical protein
LRITNSPVRGASSLTIWLEMGGLCQAPAGWALGRKCSHIGPVIGIDDAGVHHWQAQGPRPGQGADGAGDRGVDVAAAAELTGIGKAIDKVDDQQGGFVPDAHRIAHVLGLVDVEFAHRIPLLSLRRYPASPVGPRGFGASRGAGRMLHRKYPEPLFSDGFRAVLGEE